MNFSILSIALLIVVLTSCEEHDFIKDQNYVFKERYCATVTVGGFVGIEEKCFEVGDVVVGKSHTKGTVIMRIAEHTSLNDGPPSSASYQEFLAVPSKYLELQKK